jgi:hypothetical protein
MFLAMKIAFDDKKSVLQHGITIAETLEQPVPKNTGE